MTEKVALTINVTPEQRQKIETLAHERGYNAPDDYLLALVEMDSDLTKDEVLANLRQGLKEAINGEFYPVETLWDEVDDK